MDHVKVNHHPNGTTINNDHLKFLNCILFSNKLMHVGVILTNMPKNEKIS
jgi:hypothetical protein